MRHVPFIFAFKEAINNALRKYYTIKLCNTLYHLLSVRDHKLLMTKVGNKGRGECANKILSTKKNDEMFT